MIRFRLSIRALLLACMAAVSSSAAWSAEEALRVVVTVKPVHSLAAAVMAGVGTPHLLIRGGASPHDYSLRPSDARRVADADLVVSVGRGLEAGLERALAILASDGKRLEVGAVDGLVLRRFTTDGDEEDAEETARHHPHDSDSHHAHREGDPHIWLDPRNAVAIVTALAGALSAVDPAHAERYAANAGKAVERLVALDRDLAARLAPVADIPFVVFHDAYGYFADRYGLSAAGAVSVMAGRNPGARHLSDLRHAIRDKGVVCIFSEPQFPPRQAETLARDMGIRMGVLDSLGAEVPPGPNAYADILNGLAQAMVDCLAPRVKE